MENDGAGYKKLLVPGVTRGVGKYIDKCNAYQQYKNKSKALVGKLMSNAILKKP